MKLGICYMVFDGHELLEFAIKSIRNQVDHISVTFQTTSYFGNPADENLVPNVKRLKSEGLIDELIFFEPNLSLHHKINELNLRNIGLQASRNAGCTHHISADVDELYKEEELAYVKTEMESGDYDLSVSYMDTYYKDPTFLVYPVQKLLVTLIHPVSNEYEMDIPYPTFPFHMEITRRLKYHDKYRIFSKEEFTIHHMSYVRKDIRRKFDNSDNKRFYKIKKFINNFENYQLGGRVCLLPDYLNRKTIKVDNYFNITL